jgi:serine kinase of HPr protein (carbohydrate metabolism regulator)
VSYVHAVALVVGEHGLLIRGASGSGKSTLASGLVAEARRADRFGRLVADDTVGLAARGGRLVARAHPLTAGLAERRGVGIVEVAHEAACVVRLVVDLVDAAETIRLPELRDASVMLIGITVSRLAVPAGASVGDNVYRVMDCLAAFGP